MSEATLAATAGELDFFELQPLLDFQEITEVEFVPPEVFAALAEQVSGGRVDFQAQAISGGEAENGEIGKLGAGDKKSARLLDFGLLVAEKKGLLMSFDFFERF